MNAVKESAGYPERVREHFLRPRNVGRFPERDDGILEGAGGSRRLGRAVSFQLRLDGEGRIAECRYRVYGCPATVALCSLVSEHLPGMSPEQAARLRVVPLAEELGLPAEKRSAALVVEDAIRSAAARYNSGRPGSTG